MCMCACVARFHDARRERQAETCTSGIHVRVCKLLSLFTYICTYTMCAQLQAGGAHLSSRLTHAFAQSFAAHRNGDARMVPM